MKPYTFPNLGYLHHELKKEEISILLDEIEQMQKNNFCGYIPKNESLAGNIEREFLLSERSRLELKNIVLPLIETYDETFNYTQSIAILTKNCPFVLSNAWVNFQKKYEYNPIHHHSGIFSYVIWTKVPYDIENEMKNPSSRNSSSNIPGYFNFHFINTLGEMVSQHFPVDKTWENQMFFFPAKLSHSVNPFFTSDDYRISVSGNIMLDTSE